MSDLVPARRPWKPEHASPRMRRAAEHYVKHGCKAIGPSLVWAGYSPLTAKDPSANGYTHERLIAVARHYSKGAEATARSHVGAAIARLRSIMDDETAAHSAQGAAAKIIIEVAGKEDEGVDPNAVAAEEQAKWLALIKHQKRSLLRRGILLGLAWGRWESYEPDPEAECHAERARRLLERLDYLLGKGPMPADWKESEDGEGLQRPEGDPRPGSYIEAEIVEGGDGEAGPAAEPAPEAGPGPADPE